MISCDFFGSIPKILNLKAQVAAHVAGPVGVMVCNENLKYVDSDLRSPESFRSQEPTDFAELLVYF